MKDLKALPEKISDLLPKIKRYLPLFSMLLVLIIYGLLMYRVQVLNNQEPLSTDVTAASRTAQVPHIDQATLDQLKSLQDNSVSVQSLFNDARSNPFQE